MGVKDHTTASSTKTSSIKFLHVLSWRTTNQN